VLLHKGQFNTSDLKEEKIFAEPDQRIVTSPNVSTTAKKVPFVSIIVFRIFICNVNGIHKWHLWRKIGLNWMNCFFFCIGLCWPIKTQALSGYSGSEDGTNLCGFLAH